MALAREMLRQGDAPLALVAARAGYGSASAFSAAFTRQQGVAPATWARREAKQA
ncbi:helix-turn-helix domain-containing protein [Rubellimicrobium rubrum]|uniref:helix-turn-helix domain-containing protein n=1 Tax=Rubellimicrobium rubrum TaxID=2585369 RepID=UPI001C3F32FB|nr:AraC family transcriptional regulator [Rubellimicrobium rubrum]